MYIDALLGSHTSGCPSALLSGRAGVGRWTRVGRYSHLLLSELLAKLRVPIMPEISLETGLLPILPILEGTTEAFLLPNPPTPPRVGPLR